MVRLAVVEKDKCFHDKCGDLCMKVCPVNRAGKDCIVLDENKKAKIDEALCTGCGICPKRCPFGAIHVINLPEELDKPPIHRHGGNGFEIFNLPIPIFGKVVGIVGKNGIGKSTALKILAGVLKPNLGQAGREASYDELIGFFKGTEAQVFFEKVKKGEIRISYKPQQVDLIPLQAKGNVRQLLEKVDEKGRLDEVAGELGISSILGNDISQISGGELQRVAIAATVLKKANFYVFDEPTSYLDIKQRIRVSKFIRNMADEGTAVMVVEHDLIILDYMTDLVHLMYGKEGAYGIVSHPKTARVGINTYLSGYMREENVRFRDKPIKFEARARMSAKRSEPMTSWEGIGKRLGNFRLLAQKGVLNRKDVIGILGENGIGKTSFVKILADVIKPDEGAIAKKVRVSYKPQYIDTMSTEIVAVLLKDYLQKYNASVMAPLGIPFLLMKKVNELSGGELQRVAVAECLSRDAELYLLDEPSAYLDVEQRLIVSKVIREVMEQRGATALVVDHDLLFVDYLSQGIMVFEGEPAKRGEAKGPFGMQEGMNMFLEDLKLTFRRDPETNRPRANKPGSQMDAEQIRQKKLYYI